MGQPVISGPVSREQLRLWLGQPHGIAESGDHGFSDDGELLTPPADTRVLKPAAVLILLIHRAGSAMPSVLFTQRTAHLTDHAGQISFPGGRVEADDRDAAHTALRETEEETGVDADGIDIVGTLPHYTTGTGYLISPVVGWVNGPIEYRPDPTEVDECFEVPFDFLMNVENHRIESAMYKGRLRRYFAISYGSRYIWGATAGMLVSLARVLAAAQGHEVPSPPKGPLDSGAD